MVAEQNIPVPDPSLLTTEQLFREIGALKELIQSQHATIAANQQHEKELTLEKFRGVSEKFTDNRAALDKAFASSEKAIDKTETTFTNRIIASDARINDVRDRLTIIESSTRGKSEGLSTVGALVVGAFGAGTLFVAVATLLYNIFTKH